MNRERISKEDIDFCKALMNQNGIYKSEKILLKSPTSFICLCKSNRAESYQAYNCDPYYKKQFRKEKVTVCVPRFPVVALEHQTLQVAFESIFSNTVLPQVHAKQTDQYLSSFARAQKKWVEKMEKQALESKKVKRDLKEALKKIEEIKERTFKHI